MYCELTNKPNICPITYASGFVRTVNLGTLEKKKSFALIKKVSTQPKFSIQMIRETLRDDSRTRMGDTKRLNPDELKGMVLVP